MGEDKLEIHSESVFRLKAEALGERRDTQGFVGDSLFKREQTCRCPRQNENRRPRRHPAIFP